MSRNVQMRMGNPTDKQFSKLVSANKVKNCPVLPQHIANATKIFGPPTAALDGKTTRKQSARVIVQRA